VGPASHITIIKLELPQQPTRRYDVTMRLCRPLTTCEGREMVAHRSIGLDVSPDGPSQLIATHTIVEEVRRQKLITDANARLGTCPHNHDPMVGGA
jgi:hypothetical protein